MRTVRPSTFETNSSSTHTITFCEGYVITPSTNQLTITGSGEFSWQVGEVISSPTEKMNYATIAYAHICSGPDECKSVFTRIKEAFDRRGVEVDFLEDNTKPAIYFSQEPWSKDPSKLYAHTVGFIDHQSAPEESEDCCFLAEMFRDDPEALFNFVFGESFITLDNDNHM